LVFQDTGQGIPKDIRDRIFDPYFTTKETGNGLGLAVVFSIIEQHNGQIKVTSKAGEGSCFTILLPAEQAD
jgi:signal transduction histidine kinase